MRIFFQRKSLSVARNSMIFSEIENESDFKELEAITRDSGMKFERSISDNNTPSGRQIMYNLMVYLSQDAKYGPYTADRYLVKNPSLFTDDFAYKSWKASVHSRYPHLGAMWDRVEEQAEIHDELQRQVFIRDRLFKSNQDRIDELIGRLAELNGGRIEVSRSLR